MKHHAPQTIPGLWRQVLHPASGNAAPGCFGALWRASVCPARVPVKIRNPKAVPYYQAARPPYCSPPAREYSSRLRLHRRHDTDDRRRQVTKLPKTMPTVSPFHPAVRVYAGSPCLAAHGDTGAASAGLQALRVAARTFDVIALTDRTRGYHLLCLIPVRR